MRSGFVTVKKDATSKVLNSRKVFLRPGFYRAKIEVGQYVCWRSLSVDKKTGRDIHFNFMQMQQRPLRVIPEVYDFETNQDISKIVSVSIFYGGWWQPLSSVKNKLSTGQEWRIKFSAEGYKDEIFKTKVDWYQDVLYIYAQMHKL